MFLFLVIVYVCFVNSQTVRDAGAKIGVRSKECDKDVIKKGHLELALCNGFLGSFGLFGGIDDSRCGKYCTALGCALRAMGCDEEFKRMEARHNADCSVSLDCSGITGIDDQDCEKVNKIFLDKPYKVAGFGVSAEVCSNDWKTVSGFLGVFKEGASKELLDGSGECGYLCHYGICGMNILGCKEANAGIIRANNAIPACNPPIACANFAQPCRDVECAEIDCLTDELTKSEDGCCWLCPANPCAGKKCPEITCEAPFEPRQRVNVEANDPDGCCNHCTCPTVCPASTPTRESCARASVPTQEDVFKPPYRFVPATEPDACCADQCLDPCGTAIAGSLLQPCPDTYPPCDGVLVHKSSSCCKECKDGCELPGRMKDCIPILCAENEQKRRNATTCCDQCYALESPQVAQQKEESFDWFQWSLIGGGALCCCFLLCCFIIVICCIVRRNRKPAREAPFPNPMYAHNPHKQPYNAQYEMTPSQPQTTSFDSAYPSSNMSFGTNQSFY
mmetsp:Transcript_16367/g.28086  ORF Transcript_16367/g.28086 Transcript_16367/m.28086 type:complete len:505 (+) Transcript_16367:10-1524(+)